jgi:TRAP-type mannitol/chloroaromatic compound transport system substrate-binding protein
MLALAVALPLLLGPAGCDRKEEPPPAGGAEGAPDQVRWKLASAFSSTLPILGTGATELTETLARVSKGRIAIAFNDIGTLVPPLEIFPAVSKGTVEAGWSSATFWSRTMPAADFFSGVPFGPGAVEYVGWIYEGGGWQLWKELYAPHNVYPIPCGLLPPEAGGWFRDPVTRLEQFKGMKIRFFGLGGQVLQRLGASVLPLSGGDIHEALKEGLLQATEFYMPSLDEKVGFYKIVKHYYFPGWHQQSALLELIVNLERWQALAPEDQALIELACRASVLGTLAQGESQQGEALSVFQKNGVQIHTWPDDVLQGLKSAYEQVVKELRAKDSDFKRVHDSLLAYRASYEEWAKVSRLPPGF